MVQQPEVSGSNRTPQKSGALPRVYGRGPLTRRQNGALNGMFIAANAVTGLHSRAFRGMFTALNSIGGAVKRMAGYEPGDKAEWMATPLFPLHYFHSSHDVIRLVVLIYVRFRRHCRRSRGAVRFPKTAFRSEVRLSHRRAGF